MSWDDNLPLTYTWEFQEYDDKELHAAGDIIGCGQITEQAILTYLDEVTNTFGVISIHSNHEKGLFVTSRESVRRLTRRGSLAGGCWNWEEWSPRPEDVECLATFTRYLRVANKIKYRLRVSIDKVWN